MITVYNFGTPNGLKVRLMLEETALPHKEVIIDITKKEQFDKDFIKISPNNKIPALVDEEGPGGKKISLFESGAILIYLAEKSNLFFPNDPIRRYSVLKWLMFQMGGVGPMLGQLFHFKGAAPVKIDYAIERYHNEAKRLYAVIDQCLQQYQWLGDQEYSIADIATWPWVRLYENYDLDIEDYPFVKSWIDKINQRPAVQKLISL